MLINSNNKPFSAVYTVITVEAQVRMRSRPKVETGTRVMSYFTIPAHHGESPARLGRYASGTLGQAFIGLQKLYVLIF
jgi:hypothetical protein